jgi:hypothetical protein
VARFADCKSSQDELRQMADAGRLFASEKGSESGGLPVRVQSTER